MNHFSVLVHGQNYLVHTDEGPKNMGFFLTRYILAANSTEAAATVLSAVKNDLLLQKKLNLANSPFSSLVADEVEEVEAEDIPEITPGIIFYDLPPVH